MKIWKSVLLLIFFTSIKNFGQEPLTPNNISINKKLIKNERSETNWFVFKDTIKIELGKILTEVIKDKKKIVIITTINMKQTSSKWVDSTIVETKSLNPIYHSSYNQQRDMVLNFGKEVTGYYLDKKTGVKTIISEKTEKPYFDSNFYSQLIRWLPLEEGYSTKISIFDYNPNSKIGVITATIKNVKKISMNFKGEKTSVWKVIITDDILNNTAISTYYIDCKTRKTLKLDVDFNGIKKMSMELNEF